MKTLRELPLRLAVRCTHARLTVTWNRACTVIARQHARLRLAARRGSRGLVDLRQAVLFGSLICSLATIVLTMPALGQEKSVRPGINKPFEDPDTEQPRWWTNERLPEAYIEALKKAGESHDVTQAVERQGSD